MTEEQARTNDFERDVMEIKLEFAYRRAAVNPQDFLALMDIAGISWALKNYPAAEEAYQRFFTNECSNSEFWNQATYSYVNHRGTNVERAYELALKALDMSRGSPYIADTVAWIQVKRGYYEEALALVPGPNNRRGLWAGASAEVTFHTGIAHYMLLEEEPAREALEKFVADKSDFPGRAEAKAEAKACLAVLGVKAAVSKSGAIATLRARLAEEPDDPMALDRLAEYFESDASEGRLLEDPLVLKAVGLRVYRKGDYSRAAQYLTESVKSWTGDGQGFLYLGLAQNHRQRTNECVESLTRAKSFPLKAAQIAQTEEVLRALDRQ
jgi:tetratricopeptide (TPR) repeat protein